MNTPTLHTISQTISNNALLLNDKLIPHPVFVQFLKFLRLKALYIAEPKLTEGAEGLVIQGYTKWMNFKILSLEMRVYKLADKEGFDFEINATALDFRFDDFEKGAWIEKLGMNTILSTLDHTFSMTELEFDSQNQLFSFLTKDENYNLDCKPIPLILQNICLGYRKLLQPNMDESTFFIQSVIQVGETKVPVKVELPIGGENDAAGWIISNTEPIYLEQGLKDIFSCLTTLSTLDTQQIETQIPDEFKQFQQLIIEEFYMQFKPYPAKLQLIEFRVATCRSLELMKGFVIKDLALQLSMDFSLKTPNITLRLDGTFQFLDAVSTEVVVILPYNSDKNWEIQMNAGIDLESLSQLEALPFLKLTDLNLPAGWIDANSIGVENLKFIFNLKQRKVISLEMDLYLKASSQLIPGIQVKDPYLSINLNFE